MFDLEDQGGINIDGESSVLDNDFRAQVSLQKYVGILIIILMPWILSKAVVTFLRVQFILCRGFFQQRESLARI